MRTVKRRPKPGSLRRNAGRWKRELLAEISRRQRTREPVPSRFFDRYRQKDVRDSLRQMYDDRCCYCEETINIVAFEHIEHRKPKARFPADTFEWDNLHLACPKCNGAKVDKWNVRAPILDAVVDHPIETHLGYKESRLGLLRWPESDRGETTIEHADLDRPGLRQVRVEIYMETLKTIRDINESQRQQRGSAIVRAMIRELRAKCYERFGSVIAWAMNEWLDQNDAAA